jgi:hypothetical protein
MKNVELTGKMMSFEESWALEEKKYGKRNFLRCHLQDILLDAFIPIKATLKHHKEEDDMCVNPYVMALGTLMRHAEASIKDAVQFVEDRIGRIELVVASDRHPKKEEGELIGICIDATDNRAIPKFDEIFIYDVACIERESAKKEEMNKAA